MKKAALTAKINGKTGKALSTRKACGLGDRAKGTEKGIQKKQPRKFAMKGVRWDNDVERVMK